MINFAKAFPEAGIVATLWRQLVSKFGTGFSEKNLRRMMQFAEVSPILR